MIACSVDFGGRHVSTYYVHITGTAEPQECDWWHGHAILSSASRSHYFASTTWSRINSHASPRQIHACVVATVLAKYWFATDHAPFWSTSIANEETRNFGLSPSKVGFLEERTFRNVFWAINKYRFSTVKFCTLSNFADCQIWDCFYFGFKYVFRKRGTLVGTHWCRFSSIATPPCAIC